MAKKKSTGTEETTARHRRKDPGTSRAAARFVRKNLPHLENIVCSAIVRGRGRGRTLDDLADSLDMDKVTVSPRMRPLCEKGVIFASKERRPGKSGVGQIVWKDIKYKRFERRA